jgi:hypothetical protein
MIYARRGKPADGPFPKALSALRSASALHSCARCENIVAEFESVRRINTPRV